jgi:hypothetical protein
MFQHALGDLLFAEVHVTMLAILVNETLEFFECGGLPTTKRLHRADAVANLDGLTRHLGYGLIVFDVYICVWNMVCMDG